MVTSHIVSCYLDTSLISAAITESVENHRAAEVFCARLVHGGTTVYVSELVRLEYLHFLRAICPKLDPVIIQQYGLNNWHRPGVRQNRITLNMTDFDAFMGQFTIVREVSLTRDLIDEAQWLMIELNLSSNDAAHVATALAAEATDIAAVDEHFRRVRDLLKAHIVRDL